MYLGKDRKLNRWMGYDYSMPGTYFVTICTQDRVCHFGDVINGNMILNEIGEIVKKQWLWLPENFGFVELDEWEIMPNHLHGIIEIINENYFRSIGNGTTVGNGRDGKIFDEYDNVGNVLERSLHDADNTKILPLYRIVGAFKTTSSKMIRMIGRCDFQWQKSFHDRVIRNEKELNNIRYYIQQNPAKWAEDRNNPKNIK